MTTTADSDSAPVNLRPAGRVDLLAVHRLERACFPSPWPYQAFVDHLDASAFLLAIVDGELAGYIVADVADGFAGRGGHIKDLAVTERHRRRGIATRLLVAGLHRLASHGAASVSLEVRAGNEPAQALYREHGFAAERVESEYYGDGEDAVIMVRQID